MAYLTELRAQWRPLLAALIGLGSGFSTTMYVTSIMAPHMLREFGWSKSEFALIGSLSLLTVAFYPLVGRLTDMIGVRRTALIGVATLPFAYFALGSQNGDIRVYIALFLFTSIACITTTSTVYTRIVVQYVRQSRGLALAIVASGPALTGAIGGPILNNFVEAHGWRAGYMAMIVFAVVAGGVALLLMPAERRDVMAPVQPDRSARQDYGTIVRNPAFWIMIVGLLLCNLSQVIGLTQLNLVLLDNGVSVARVSGAISVFATGVLAGRFISGLALDRFPSHIVAAIALGMPGFGLFLLASSFDAYPAVLAAILLLGLSNGAEGDLVGYIVVRKFGVRNYSSVMGLMTASIAISASVGAVLLSLTLKLTGNYAAFLAICGVSVLAGALLFFLLGRGRAGTAEMMVD